MTRPLEQIAIYCGSSNRADPAWRELAYEVGQTLAERGIGVIYGGGDVGLMGAVARGALDHDGQVVGVITEQLMGLEIGRLDLAELHVVPTMHERKQRMTDLADAFLALPGGYGTLDEIFEAVTWSQLNVHRKPCGLLNARGYFDHLAAFLDHAAAEGFIREPHRALLATYDTLDQALEGLAAAEVPTFGNWVVAP